MNLYQPNYLGLQVHDRTKYLVFAAKESSVYRRLRISWWYELLCAVNESSFFILGGFGRFALR
jgi:hypothetical protein